MNTKSDSELMDYVTKIERYTPTSIRAAIDELKKRGHNFSDEELSVLNRKIHDNIEREKGKDDVHPLKGSSKWKRNVVTDANAPLYYSPGAIGVFSIVFTVVFGAVLLASNITNKKHKWTVIGFGIIYSALVILISQIPNNTSFTIISNIIGAGILTTVFWNKYIGRDTKFRTKPIWKALSISILITIPFVLAAIYG